MQDGKNNIGMPGSMMHHDNLYYPVMYLIRQYMKRHGYGEGGPTLPEDYVEPVELHRDEMGRLELVEGWEYVDVRLKYDDELGVLQYADVEQKLTGRIMRINLEFDEDILLKKVIPEMLELGLGEPGKINIPRSLEDY